MNLTALMQQKIEKKIKLKLEEILLIKLNVLICKDKQYELILSSNQSGAEILYRAINEKLCEIISQVSGLNWELQEKSIYLKGGYIVYSEEIDGDLLEQKWKWDGEEFDFEGTYQNEKEITCSSFDSNCPCPVHTWEPDIRDFEFER